MARNKHKGLSSKDDRIARRLKVRLQGITPLKRLVVFGSRARGTADSDSDLDIFIEVPALDARLRWQISKIAWEVSLDEGIVISTFVASSDAITDSPLAANPILYTIEMEGILI